MVFLPSPPLFFFFWSPAELGIRNWFPSPVAPQKAYHHYCRAEEREGRGSKIPDNYLSLVSRGLQEELKWGGGGMKRRGISKRPVFLFSSCKCAVISQPRRESLTEMGTAGWGGETEKKRKKNASLCCLGTKISFHAATKLCLCMFADRNDF